MAKLSAKASEIVADMVQSASEVLPETGTELSPARAQVLGEFARQLLISLDLAGVPGCIRILYALAAKS